VVGDSSLYSAGLNRNRFGVNIVASATANSRRADTSERHVVILVTIGAQESFRCCSSHLFCSAKVKVVFRKRRITCRATVMSSLFARCRLIAGNVSARSNFTLVFLSQFYNHTWIRWIHIGSAELYSARAIVIARYSYNSDRYTTLHRKLSTVVYACNCS